MGKTPLVPEKKLKSLENKGPFMVNPQLFGSELVAKLFGLCTTHIRKLEIPFAVIRYILPSGPNFANLGNCVDINFLLVTRSLELRSI